MRVLCTVFLAGISLYSAEEALAEGVPLGGAVYNFAENERISYFCLLKSETVIECNFTSAEVSQVLPEDEIEARRTEEYKNLDVPGAIEEFAEGACEAIDRIEQDLADGDVDEVEAVPKEDFDAAMAVFRSICEKRDRASVQAFIDLGIDTQARTCMISTFSWDGRFERNDERTWVRVDNDGPVGDGCGGVYLDRFELSESGSFWNLVRRSIASNPNGTFTTGEQCSEIYTGEEVTYEWQGGDLPGRCDYIRFNLLN